MTKETLTRIKEALTLVPYKPGCYQMYNARGEIIYVGKAKILANRLKSYFTGSHNAKTTQMVSEVDHFEYIITRTETEAFLLELNFIKKNRPRYNIMLMDDKTYPYICVTHEANPRILVTRESKKYTRKGAKLYGPYPNVKACRDIADILNKVYPFRKCNQIPKNKCLYYDMGQCLGPCINKIKHSDYTDYLKQVNSFLNGSSNDLRELLVKKMNKASEDLEFEKAIEYRELISSVDALVEKQTMIINDGVNRDIFGYYVQNDIVCIQVLHSRNGKIIERKGEVFDLVDDLNNVLLSYIYSFYDNNSLDGVKEVLIPYIEGYEILTELYDVKFVVPIRGTKKKLTDLVCENAKNNLDNLQKLKLLQIKRTKEPLYDLAKMLDISYPHIIELFDNSNLFGASPVSAMVRYIDGVKSTNDYRKYKVKTVVGADDYHTMQEVIRRRYKRLLDEKSVLPDMIIVDGAEPQVNAAQAILDELKITTINLIGLGKDDHHRTDYIYYKGKEYHLEKRSDLYLLLENMQDEVHRYAITFFRHTHAKNSLASKLDEIKGVGKNRKLKLMEAFDTLDDIKKASDEKLKSLGLPKDVIENLRKNL